MIERDREIETVQKLLQRHPVVGIVGARQVGKTRTQGDLEGHPKVGASWEGFVLGQIIRLLGVRSDECFFWATHGGAELDLLVVRGRQRLGVEIKRTSSPRITPSMRNALSDLKLQHVDIIHAGEMTFPMSKNIRAVALSRLLEDIKPLR